jgi:acetoacetyl-CoA synthetase
MPDEGTDPSGTVIEQFAAMASARHGLALGDYRSLHTWSVSEPEQFWATVLDFFDVRLSAPYTRVLSGDAMPAQRWFEGARLNYADQVLRHETLRGPAVIALAEDGGRVEVGWAELATRVRAFSHTLKTLGVRPGDRVAGYVTNSPEAVIAFLGAAHAGATWVACGPDYGATAAAGRLGQVTPVVLVATTAYEWAGRPQDRREVVAHLARATGVRAVVSVERCGRPLDENTVSARVITWSDAVADAPAADAESVQLPGDHPLWILFTSGTTGVPKGIVHGHAGVLAAHLGFLGLQHDLRPGRTLFWYTTTNWMLWNVVVSALLTGATTVTYEGSPAHPGADRLWRIVEREGVAVFGTSPGHLQHGKTVNLRPGPDHGLSRLREIAATGAPVAAPLYDWVTTAVGPDIRLTSVCGGTDVVSAFLGGAPTLPVRPGEISGPQLGVAAATFDPGGRAVRDEVGELVVTAPYPSMPLGLWNDPGGTRYRQTYFGTYPGVWRQGDWATHTSRGSFVVHGRSDSTLNRNGVRIGSTDLYRIVENIPFVAEALVLGVELPGGGYRMPMFLVPAAGRELGEKQLDHVRHLLRTEGSPRHVPDEIHVVDALPHTKTGKKIEVPLKRILQGANPATTISEDAVDRPELLEYYRDLARQWRAQS